MFCLLIRSVIIVAFHIYDLFLGVFWNDVQREKIFLFSQWQKFLFIFLYFYIIQCNIHGSCFKTEIQHVESVWYVSCKICVIYMLLLLFYTSHYCYKCRGIYCEIWIMSDWQRNWLWHILTFYRAMIAACLKGSDFFQQIVSVSFGSQNKYCLIAWFYLLIL